MGIAANRQLPVHEAPSCVPGDNPALADMVDWINRLGPTSGTEALRRLRAAYPDSPLTLRVAALNALIRRQGGDTNYIPR